MGQAWNGKATKSALTMPPAIAKRAALMRTRGRCLTVAAAAKSHAGRSEFDAEYEEEAWLEPAAQIAQFLDDFSARSDWVAAD